MKKFAVIMLAIIMVIALCGCGDDPGKSNSSNNSNSSPADNSANTVPSGDPSGEPKYELIYGGVNVFPGCEYDEKALSALEPAFSEIPGCALGTTDKLYTFADVELQVAEMSGKEVVYSAYFISMDLSTPEGVSIGTTKDKVLEAYGKDYTTLGDQMTYTLDGVTLNIIVQNDMVTSIEYTMIL